MLSRKTKTFVIIKIFFVGVVLKNRFNFARAKMGGGEFAYFFVLLLIFLGFAFIQP